MGREYGWLEIPFPDLPEKKGDRVCNERPPGKGRKQQRRPFLERKEGETVGLLKEAILLAASPGLVSSNCKSRDHKGGDVQLGRGKGREDPFKKGLG